MFFIGFGRRFLLEVFREPLPRKMNWELLPMTHFFLLPRIWFALFFFQMNILVYFVTAGILTKFVMHITPTAKTKCRSFSINVFRCFLGRFFSRFQKIYEKSVKFSLRFIYLERFLLQCWLFVVYIFSGRQNISVNQHLLLYLLRGSILMSLSGFTTISELKGFYGAVCNFTASLLIRYIWKTS